MYPVLYNSSFLTLYAYPMFLGLALGVGYYISFYLFHIFKKNSKTFFLLWWPAVISAWVGAKVLFLLTNLGSHPVGQWAGMSSFWLGGGFVFYGGLLFALGHVLIGLRKKWFELSDVTLFIPGIAFGHSVGRIGCFLAGCCYGSHSTNWDHIFLHNSFRYPVQLYEAVSLALLGVVLWKMVRSRKKPTAVILTYVLSYSVIRFLLEFIRGDKLRGIWGVFSTSQIISLILVFLAVLFWLRQRKQA